MPDKVENSGTETNRKLASKI